ncbi:hypothetical protein AB4Y36_01480 [Paraburkholderia sp. BR10936]|uniref:hypothetical protein n=1 Tax=Paraburkholderia sp. BR10936 TaxID=3236993 RepID=UPI0034D2C326
MKTKLGWVAPVAAALLCTACGSFQLGYVKPSQGQSRELMNSDMLFCKDQAKTESESGGNQATEFLLGATLVGYPAARQHNIDNQRAAYRVCMEQRGYEYLGTEPPARQATNPSQLNRSALFHLPN